MDGLVAVAVELVLDDLQKIENALREITVQGDRYPKQLKQMSDR